MNREQRGKRWYKVVVRVWADDKKQARKKIKDALSEVSQRENRAFVYHPVDSAEREAALNRFLDLLEAAGSVMHSCVSRDHDY